MRPNVTEFVTAPPSEDAVAAYSGCQSGLARAAFGCFIRHRLRVRWFDVADEIVRQCEGRSAITADIPLAAEVLESALRLLIPGRTLEATPRIRRTSDATLWTRYAAA